MLYHSQEFKHFLKSSIKSFAETIVQSVIGGGMQSLHSHSRGELYALIAKNVLQILVTVVASAFSSGTASGQHSILKSTQVRRCPSVERSLMGPTMSTATLSNGSVMRSRSSKGAGCTRPLSVEFWQMSQDFTNRAMSAFTPCQKNWLLKRLWVFCRLMWPLKAAQWPNFMTACLYWVGHHQMCACLTMFRDSFNENLTFVMEEASCTLLIRRRHALSNVLANVFEETDLNFVLPWVLPRSVIRLVKQRWEVL